MARGQVTIPVPIPTAGWRTDAARHELPPNCLYDGINVYVDEDGLLKPRNGYRRIDPIPDFQDDDRVMGGISFRTPDLIPLIVATLRRWYLLDGGVWYDISGGALLNGVSNAPSRLRQFAYAQDGNGDYWPAVYGVNGVHADNMKLWLVDTSVNATPQPPPLPPIPPNPNPYQDATGTGLPFKANDLAIVGDRLVAVNIYDTTDHPIRVRWSAVLNGQEWPVLAYNDLAGLGRLIAIATTSRTAAVVYADNGAYLMTAQAGTDAGAFRFDRIEDVTVGPFSSGAVIDVGGVHFYLAEDLRIWVCNGSSAQPMSLPIDKGLQLLVESGTGQKVSGFYDMLNYRLVWFFVKVGDTVTTSVGQNQEEPRWAISFNLKDRTWNVPWQFANYMTAAIPVIEQLGPTWDNPGQDAAGTTFTWETAPWRSWNEIPYAERPVTYIGNFETGADGMLMPCLCRWWETTADRTEVAISCRSTWALQSVVDRSERLEINQAELLLVPALIPESSGPEVEEITFRVDGLRTPYDTDWVSIVDWTGIDLNDPATWELKLNPSTVAAAPRPSNYLRVTLTSASRRGKPTFAGATLFAHPTKRLDP